MIPKTIPAAGAWVYVAGPYTAPSPPRNVLVAVRVATALRRAGLVPVCPHLFHLADAIEPAPYEFWCSWDLELLRRCEIFVRLPGASPGTEVEELAARADGCLVVSPLTADPDEVVLAVAAAMSRTRAGAQTPPAGM